MCSKDAPNQPAMNPITTVRAICSHMRPIYLMHGGFPPSGWKPEGGEATEGGTSHSRCREELQTVGLDSSDEGHNRCDRFPKCEEIDPKGEGSGGMSDVPHRSGQQVGRAGRRRFYDPALHPLPGGADLLDHRADEQTAIRRAAESAQREAQN